MIKKVLGVILVVVVLGAVIPVLWELMTSTDTDIQALNATGSVETGFLQAMWPVALLIIGIGIAAGIIFFALKKFNVIGRR